MDWTIIEDIVAEIEHNEKQVIPNREKNNILRFSDANKAIEFWLKLKEMGLEGKFTAQY